MLVSPSLVGTLFRPGGPATVARFVIPFIVDAVQSFTRRTRPHIGQEIVKLLPALANGNAAATIVLEMNVPRLRTTYSHAKPGLVFRRGLRRKCVPVTQPDGMFSQSLAINLNAETTAAHRGSIFYIVARKGLERTAIAQEKPINLTMTSRNARRPLRNQLPEPLPGYVGKLHVPDCS